MRRFNDIRDADKARRCGALSVYGIGTLVRFLFFAEGGVLNDGMPGVRSGVARTWRTTHTRRVTRVERLARCSMFASD
jgi:hypothetical protein